MSDLDPRNYVVSGEDYEEVCLERARLKTTIQAARKLVCAQAEDEGLWFIAKTAPEAYLQQELRRLHAMIEGA